MSAWGAGNRVSPSGRRRWTPRAGRLLMALTVLLAGLTMCAPGSALASSRGTARHAIDLATARAMADSSTGAISGVVTGASGNLCIQAFDTYGNEGDTSAENGKTYTISDLPPGSYTVYFGCSGSDDAYQYYDNVSHEGDATPVTVTAGETTTGIDDHFPASGEISGTVTDSNGTGVKDICVDAYAPDGDGSGSATTNASGHYTISDLYPGSYTVQFTDCSGSGYTSQYYDNVSTLSAATPVAVGAGQIAAGINAILAGSAPPSTGKITGTVTDSHGKPLQFVCVSVGSRSADTGADGSYTISGLPAGSYTVQFQNCSGDGNYLTQYYDNVTNESDATPVSVTNGQTTANIDDALGAGGQITGTVTDAGGNDLSSICVSALDSNGDTGEARTDQQGQYTMSELPTGSYTVEFSDCNDTGNYLTQYYDNVTSQSSATPVPVTAGQTVSDIDDALGAGGQITGTVTDASGNDLPNICVTATDRNGDISRATTGQSGQYMFSELPTGSYTVEFSDCHDVGNYLTQYYDNVTSQSSATPVPVTAGQTTSGIDDSLAIGGQITGTVTDASGHDLESFCVTASDANGDFGHAYTDENGDYTIVGLPTGSYTVEFSDCNDIGNYLTQYYDNVTDEGDAALVSVTAGQTTSGINDALAPGGQITGTVTDANGNDLPNICLSATDGNGDAGYATTGEHGTYTISGLPTGSYTVEYTDCNAASSYQTQYYDNVTNPSSATPVSVTAGQTTSGIDDALAAGSPGGQISGTVTDSGGDDLQGICVIALNSEGNPVASATTGANGGYNISGLPAATYTVEFTGCNGAAGPYQTQYYDNVTSPSSGAPVSVNAGQTTANINDALGMGGQITGTVMQSNGVKPFSQCVSATDSDGATGSAITAPNGSYIISGLPPGSYTVEFFGCGIPPGPDYVTEYYDNVTNQAAATPVSVSAGKTTSGINFVTIQGGLITGVVTDGGGHPLQNICVTATAANGNGTGSNATTGPNGGYSIQDLPTGTYNVEFKPCSGSRYPTQYYDNVTSEADATPVSVTAGQTTSGIGDALAPEHTLTVQETGSGSGTVTDAGGGINCPAQSCSEQDRAATSVTLTAAPASGSTFAGWSGACQGTGTCTVTLNADTTVTATFTSAPAPPAASATLSVAAAGSGSGTVTGTGIDCPGTCSHSYANGTPVALTATPATGSTFAGWSGSGCGAAATCTVDLNANTTVTATFNRTVTAPGSGSAGATLTAQLRALLNSILAPHGRAAKISRILKSRGYVSSVSSPLGATLRIKWYEVRHRAHSEHKQPKPVLVASGRLTLAGAGHGRLKLTLTTAGRRLLEHASHIRLISDGSLFRDGARTIRATRSITLKR